MRSTWLSPWRSDREIAETVIFGRQVITLMSLALLIAAGLLLDLEDLGIRLAWFAFQVGACWVAWVDLPDEAGHPPPDGAGVREPRRPTPEIPTSSVAAPSHKSMSMQTDSDELATAQRHEGASSTVGPARIVGGSAGGSLPG